MHPPCGPCGGQGREVLPSSTLLRFWSIAFLVPLPRGSLKGLGKHATAPKEGGRVACSGRMTQSGCVGEGGSQRRLPSVTVVGQVHLQAQTSGRPGIHGVCFLGNKAAEAPVASFLCSDNLSGRIMTPTAFALQCKRQFECHLIESG